VPSDQISLVRQWTLLNVLCTRGSGVTVREMAEELNVCEKTIRRDLETFQHAGFPLDQTVEDHGRKKWRMESTNHQPGLLFGFDEAIALYLGWHLMEPLAGTPFWKASRRSFQKIKAMLGTGALEYIEQFAEIFYQTRIGISDYSKKADLIDQLMQGIEDRRAVFITYQSLRATEPVTYDIYPYGLAYHRGSLYLVGWSPDRKEIRHWKVDRMESAEPTPIPFNRPEDFDLKRHLAGSFGVYHGDGQIHVKVRFTPTVARYVQESKWHDSQRLIPQPDGSLVAEFDLSDIEEIKRWVLSFGRHAVVVEPERLREEIAEEVRDLMLAYKGSSQQREDFHQQSK